MQLGDGAGVAHHDFFEQLPQLFAVARVGGIAAGHEFFFEGLQGFEVPGLEQGYQVEELFQVVLDRGGGKHEEEALLMLLTSFQLSVVRFFRWWASSTITIS